MIGETYKRAASIPGVSQICTVTNEDHFFLALDCYDETGIEHLNGHFILEPFGRNTAAAIASAVLHVQEVAGNETILLVLPADHMINDVTSLNSAYQQAFTAAEAGKIVTFGISPSSPETGYGYIELNDGQFVRFVEKPDVETARTYVDAGTYFWNSGMFCFEVRTMLSAMQQYCPDVLQKTKECMNLSETVEEPRGKTTRLDRATFSKVPDISIDYAVMEKAANVSCITTNCGWSDIGSWVSFAEMFQQDGNNNRCNGDVITVGSNDCFIDANTRLVGLVGVKDLIVVDTADALLVASKQNAQDVKEIFTKLAADEHDAAMLHRTVHRPWGTYTILDEGERFKTKRIVVKPGARLSLQSHSHRSEHWVVVSGTAKVTNGDEEFILTTNQSTYIPCGNKHRLENPDTSPLVLIEVQSGDYLGEDDIIRYDDKYGRS